LKFCFLKSIMCKRVFIWGMVRWVRAIRVMVLNATFNNISGILRGSVLLVEKTGVLGENHRPVASHW